MPSVISQRKGQNFAAKMWILSKNSLVAAGAGLLVGLSKHLSASAKVSQLG